VLPMQSAIVALSYVICELGLEPHVEYTRKDFAFVQIW